ncbi:MAG: hypothetical protein EGR89_06480 [[Eubacterium] rectale]|nr:hypothetical protein [Agathobacter rectalis]
MKDFFIKVKEFCSDNKKYVGVAVVLLCLIILLVAVAANGKKNRKENTEATEQTQVSVEDFQFETEYTDDKKDEITQLLQNYYTAYVSADLDTLAKIAYPMSDNEKSYIGVVSQYYETVSDITVYSKAGLENGSYFVSVENNIKFYGVDTVAPTLDFFYIATDDNGQLYINNVYSNFNRTYAEEELDSGIVSLISKYTSDSDFANLQESVQSKYDEAVNGDANLKEMLETTLTGAIKQWYTTVRVDNSTQTTEQSTEQSSEQQADDQTAADQSSQATDQNAQNAQNTDQAAQNTADQNAQNTDQAAQNTADQNAQNTQNTDQAAQNTADQSAQNAQNTDQTAQNTTDQAAQDTQPSEYAVQTTDVVNVRAIADPNGKLLGKLTEGVKLTAYGTYGEWTKISYSGSENGVGFIKTELLKTVE